MEAAGKVKEDVITAKKVTRSSVHALNDAKKKEFEANEKAEADIMAMNEKGKLDEEALKAEEEHHKQVLSDTTEATIDEYNQDVAGHQKEMLKVHKAAEHADDASAMMVEHSNEFFDTSEKAVKAKMAIVAAETAKAQNEVTAQQERYEE